MWKLYIIFFLLPLNTKAQSDFIILKKKNKTIQSFYAGTHIAFTSTNGAYRDAEITQIKNDSIFLREYLVQMVPSTMGFLIRDTVGSFRYVYHYTDIKRFGKEDKHFNISGSGASLMGGGFLLAFGSGIVYLADRKKYSPTLLYAGLGGMGVGYLLNKAGSKGIVIGKKHYHLQYMNMSK